MTDIASALTSGGGVTPEELQELIYSFRPEFRFHIVYHRPELEILPHRQVVVGPDVCGRRDQAH